ncbi:MAG: choice-of-anchor J domain-containing protein [Candidatus Cryptobacteroides sp.]
MKKTIKLFGVVLAAAAMFAACVQDPEVKPSEKATTLSIEPATIEAEIAPNGPFDVQVKANGTWVVVNSLDWVTVEPNKGEGDATVQVTVAANEKDGEQLAPRSGEISFVGAATCSQTLAIAQAGNEDLLVEAVPYTINFCETQGTWTIEDKTLPEALTYVWAQTANYGMKASAYVNQCYATESWLISPVFDLTKETVAILNIEHALNKGSNAKCAVMAKTTDSAEWVKLDVPTWPGTANEDGSYTGSSWDFVESGDIDLTAFCGKKAQIAFVYGSTEADAPTWEIKTVVVTNDASPKFSVPTEDINLRAFDTKATIKVSGNVDWTAVASEGATVEPAEGKGGLTVTVTIPENTDMENAKEYTVTFKTTAAVETAEYVVKIVQAKAEELPTTTLAQIFEKGVGVYATGELTVMAKASGNVIVSDGTANMMYYKSGNELVPGQVIKFANADVKERNGLLQIDGSECELLEKTVTPEYGTAVEIATDEDVQNWGGEPQYQYIHFTGVMADDNRTIKCGEWGLYIVKTEGFAGKTVSVYGYANGKASSYQTITTTLVSIEAIGGEEPEPEPVPEVATLAQIFEKGAGVYDPGELVVMAKAAGNVIVSDGTANMMYYKKGNELTPGQVIKFAAAEVQERNGLLQINASEYELLDKTVTPEYGTPVEILTDEAVQAWAGEPQYQYIHFEGVMGDDNRTIKCSEWGIYIIATEGFAGKKVSVHGYANGTANTQFQTITTTLVSIEAIAGEEPEPEPVPETALKNCGEINAAILAGETALTINLENPAEITLMGSDKKSVFVQDETGAVLIYSGDLYTLLSGAGAVAGYAIQGEFTATATVYNGLPEITAAEVGASNLTATNKFPCLNLTISALLADFDKYLNCKVKISDVTVTDGWSASDKSGKIAQGENEIPLYVKNYSNSITVSIPTGAKGSFTGFVAYNNTTKQLTFWEDSGFEATELPGIITVKSSVSLEVGATAELAATVNSGAAISYASADETVATVSAEGVVTAVKEGTTTITVTAPATGIYTAASAEVAVTVTASGAAVPTWTKVETVADLLDGGTAIIGYNSDNGFVPMANIGSATASAAGFMYSGAAASSGDKTVLDMANPGETSNFEVTIEASTVVEGAVCIKAKEGYIGNENTKNNCKLYAEQAVHTSFVPTVEGGVFTLKLSNANYHTLQYNASSPRFAVYGGTQKNVVIYILK